MERSVNLTGWAGADITGHLDDVEFAQIQALDARENKITLIFYNLNLDIVKISAAENKKLPPFNIEILYAGSKGESARQKILKVQLETEIKDITKEELLSGIYEKVTEVNYEMP